MPPAPPLGWSFLAYTITVFFCQKLQYRLRKGHAIKPKDKLKIMDTFRFDALESSLILRCRIGSPPVILYWGRKLSNTTDDRSVEALGMRQGMHGVADIDPPQSLALEPGLGYAGPCGFSAHRAGQDWASLFVVESATRNGDKLHIGCVDARTRLRLDYQLTVDAHTGLFTVSARVTNHGDSALDLVDMATACLPVPQPMTTIIGFSGRWTQEFGRERIDRFSGTYLRENRHGRTSHDSFPALILCSPETNESAGEAYGFHLAWSGNHRLRVDSVSDGRVFASLGALLLPGEIRLEPGAHYDSPEIIAAYASNGLSALSQKFQAHIRAKILRPSMRAKPRPVHYNSWEAVYFDHDFATLSAIASRAAALGVERFVLDDGWFGGRRDDTAGLGDWFVSDAVYPKGLKPLIDHVTGLGMEMGLWFEPEMVNPDSDLFRAHPEWALRVEGVDHLPFRNQLVLDIARTEVSDYLFDRIDAILAEHPIGYIKWDMNRDLSHPGGPTGEPRAHAQVSALWNLLDRIRAAHPSVEIESCASGGGRADLGVLAHTDRVWTSDNNDALERQAIQRGASYFLPLEVMGAHVGPSTCHVTGRTLSMAMRAGTALMGHMGLELNLLTEPDSDLDILKRAISLHKIHRDLLHSGDLYRIDTPEQLTAMGVVATDKSEGLFSVAFTASLRQVLPDRIKFVGLDPKRLYLLRLVWPEAWEAVKAPSAVEALELTGAGAHFTGEALMTVGFQLPATKPETVLLFHVAG
jgi:alpha-galactosidase